MSVSCTVVGSCLPVTVTGGREGTSTGGCITSITSLSETGPVGVIGSVIGVVGAGGIGVIGAGVTGVTGEGVTGKGVIGGFIKSKIGWSGDTGFWELQERV